MVTERKCIICNGKQFLIFSYRNFFYYRCQNCHIVSTYPLPNATMINQHYKERFKKGNYQLLQKYSKQYLTVYAQFVDILDKKLDLENQSLSGKKVLDVGCFTGDFLTLMKKKGADVYGIELQDDAVKIANKKLNGRVINADISTYHIQQKNFDIITLLGLVEHVPNPAKLIKQSHRLLKKKGTIMIQTPNSRSFLAGIMKQYWPPYSPVEHIHLFSRKSLELALQENGFENISFRSHWKKLPIGYVYNMFSNFGPEFYSLLKPLDDKLSRSQHVLPFFIGEMIITATKK